MAGAALDLPLVRGPALRLQSALVAAAVLLALLALQAALLFDQRLRDLASTPLTLTLAAGGEELPALRAWLEARDDVAFLEVLSGAELRELVAAPADADPALIEAALPKLVDVTFQPGRADAETFQAELAQSWPGVALAAPPPADAGRLLRLRNLALAAALAALLSPLAGAVGIARAHVRHHAPTLQLLRELGAQDRLLLRALDAQLWRGSLLGALAGTALALPVLLAWPRWLPDAPSWRELLGPFEMLVLASVPLAMAGLAGLIGQLALARALNRLPHSAS